MSRAATIEADQGPPKGTWKQRIAHEFIDYWINVLYLSVFFGAFLWYRRFVLSEYGIAYLHYGEAIIEALILAKVILIGDAIGLSRGSHTLPLIYPTLRKTFVFTLFVALFSVLEHIVEGLVQSKGAAGGLHELWAKGRFEIVSRCFVMFFAFIPFFAFRELAIVMGERKLGRMFFRRGAARPSAWAAPA